MRIDIRPSSSCYVRKMEWTEVSRGVFQRPCKGQEHSASFNQNIADGHTELSVAVPFRASACSNSQVTERVRWAWHEARITHPEIAIELSTGQEIPQQMTYRQLMHEDEVNRWEKETLVICSTEKPYEKVMEMTYDRRLPTRGKQSMMFYVPSLNDDKPHCLIWNVSHAVTDAFSIIAFLNDFLQSIADPSGSHTEFSAHRLPASLIVSYEKRFTPSEQETKENVGKAREQVGLYAQKLHQSVAMRPRVDHADRPHKTHCLFSKIGKQESSVIYAKLKEQKMSITFYAAAATILAVKDLYGRGGERGALLGMTRNGRRWINTTGADGAATIPMATDVVFLWIPFADEHTKASETLNLATKIRQELAPHLRSPHYMASMQLMCSEFVENLKSALAAPPPSQDPTTVPTVEPSPPGFSPQGKLDLKKYFTGNKPTSTPIERITLHHTGRQVNASPWIGMFSLDEEIHMSIGFDEKYYEPSVIERFFARYNQYLLDVSRTPVKPTEELSSNVQARL